MLKLVKISIIVPAFNEEKLLGESLARMKSAAAVFDRRGWPVELVVCDNNSTDHTADIARHAGARSVFEPVNQIAAPAIAAPPRPPGLAHFLWTRIRIPARSCLRMSRGRLPRRLPGGGATVRLDDPHWLAQGVSVFWNLLSRSFRLLAGFFIFCETEWFRGDRRVQQRTFCRRRIGTGAAAQKAGPRVREAAGHSPPLFADHVRPENPPYSFREHLQLMARAALNRRILTRREACHLWYDGRR